MRVYRFVFLAISLAFVSANTYANNDTVQAFGMNVAQLTAALQENLNKKYVLAQIEAPPSASYYVNLDMTFQELQTNLQQQAATPGHSLVAISSFTKAGVTHFAALWE